jgi:hypothetical protein
MTVFTRLKLKDQTSVVVLNAPASFEAERIVLSKVRALRDTKDGPDIRFALAFTATLPVVDQAARAIAPKLQGDGITWLVNPR